jgi:hypothetical protein
MGKHRNPNPDHYKVAGGPKPAKARVRASRQALESRRAELARWSMPKPKPAARAAATRTARAAKKR